MKKNFGDVDKIYQTLVTYPTLPDFGLVIIAVLNIKIGTVDLVKKQIMTLKIRNQGEILYYF